MGEDSHHGGGSALDMGGGSNGADQDQNRTELTKLEIELCKQNFGFYDHRKVGSVERFELPMLLNGRFWRSKSLYSLRVLPGRQAAGSAELIFR